jgi:hypothetical protein
MATTIQRVDKDTFQPRQPRYQDRHGQAVIGKLLGCGTPESGYTTYLCPHCLEEKRVAFSCQSSFCLSGCKGSCTCSLRIIAPPRKLGKMPPYHPMVRGLCHDSTPNSVRHSFCMHRQTPSSVVWERLWSRSPLLVTTVERWQLGKVGFHFCLGRPAGEGMTEHLIGAPCGLPPGPQRDEQTSDDRAIDLDGDPVGVMA